MNDKLEKVAAVLVGCGSMGGGWLKVAGDISNLEIVGLVDIEKENALKRASEYGLEKTEIGTDFGSVLKKVSPDIVFNCTIPEAHTQVTLQALDHGCHVLQEKPMADSMDNAKRIVAAAKKAGKLVAVTQNYRYNAPIRRLRDFLLSGDLGNLTTVHSDFYIGAHFGGFRDHMRHVLLLDMAIHTFDAARFITGKDPLSVYCKEWNPSGSWYDYDASAVAVFQMTEGVVYTYRGSWCAEGLNTPWGSEWRIICEKGSIKWDGAEHYQVQVLGETGGFISNYQDLQIPEYAAKDKVEGHASLIKEFVHCVRMGEKPETICTDNIKSLSMVFGAIESARRQGPIDIESDIL